MNGCSCRMNQLCAAMCYQRRPLNIHPHVCHRRTFQTIGLPILHPPPPPFPLPPTFPESFCAHRTAIQSNCVFLYPCLPAARSGAFTPAHERSPSPLYDPASSGYPYSPAAAAADDRLAPGHGADQYRRSPTAHHSPQHLRPDYIYPSDDRPSYSTYHSNARRYLTDPMQTHTAHSSQQRSPLPYHAERPARPQPATSPMHPGARVSPAYAHLDRSLSPAHLRDAAAIPATVRSPDRRGLLGGYAQPTYYNLAATGYYDDARAPRACSMPAHYVDMYQPLPAHDARRLPERTLVPRSTRRDDMQGKCVVVCKRALYSFCSFLDAVFRFCPLLASLPPLVNLKSTFRCVCSC